MSTDDDGGCRMNGISEALQTACTTDECCIDSMSQESIDVHAPPVADVNGSRCDQLTWHQARDGGWDGGGGARA